MFALETKKLLANRKVQAWLFGSAAIILLIIQLGIQLHLASVDGETTDEPSHLNAAYSYVTTGQFRFNPEHPPLTKELSGLAILHLHPKTTPQMTQLFNQSSNFFYDSWLNNLTSASIFTYQAGNNANQLIFWGRLPYVLITTLLGLSIFIIGWREWGPIAAFIATAIYVFDPTVTAHGHLMTTDIPAALGYLWVIYSGWKFFIKPSWGWAAGLGAATALALLLKYTTVIALPVLVVFFVIGWVASKDKNYWKKSLPKLLLSLVVTVALIWACYGFHDRVAPPATSFTSEWTYLGNHNGSLNGYVAPSNPSLTDRLYTVTRPVLDLLPGDFVKGMYMVVVHGDDGGQTEYLLGQTSSNGWWYYFPIVIFFKTPIPSLIMAGVAYYFILRQHAITQVSTALGIGALLFLGIALFSKADLGIRYILPLLPLSALLIGYALSKLPGLQYLTAALLIWLVAIFVFSYPYYMGYFNNFVGGSYHGYQYRSDSDVDWGQDIKRIADYIHTNNITDAYVDYSWDSSAALDYYIGQEKWQPLTAWHSGEPGVAIISASAWSSTASDKTFHNSSVCTDLTHLTPSVLICNLQ